MDILDDLFELFVVASVAALAPMISALIPKIPVPQVVILIIGGIVIGPAGFGLEDSEALSLIANVGLGFVFLLAGFEIEPALLTSRPGRLALVGWLISAVAACATVGVLAAMGYVHAFVPVALALTTTALGTVLPILRENHMSGGAFGRMFMAVGAIGELFPILAIAIFLGVNSRLSALISIAAIGLVAVILAGSQRLLRGGRLEGIVNSAAEATGQTTLRLSMLLLLGLLVLAGEFGLDVVLGAFLAGVVLRRWAPGDTHAFANKLDAIGWGFFIPVFFVSAGMDVDVDSIIEAPARLLVFLVLLLCIRGLSALVIYRKELVMRERVQLMLCSATTLPLIVALTQIGLASDTMLPENAAALVGAGVLSVLLFPLTAVLLKRPDPAGEQRPVTTQGTA